MTALMYAAHYGHANCLEVLLAHLPCVQVNAANTYGQTALMLAAGEGREACVTALIALGAERCGGLTNPCYPISSLCSRTWHRLCASLTCWTRPLAKAFMAVRPCWATSARACDMCLGVMWSHLGQAFGHLPVNTNYEAWIN